MPVPDAGGNANKLPISMWKSTRINLDDQDRKNLTRMSELQNKNDRTKKENKELQELKDVYGDRPVSFSEMTNFRVPVGKQTTEKVPDAFREALKNFPSSVFENLKQD